MNENGKIETREYGYGRVEEKMDSGSEEGIERRIERK